MSDPTQFDPNAPFASRAYVSSNLSEKLRSAKVGFLSDVKALWSYLNDSPSAGHVAIILFALGYFVSPVDAVPDLIPVAGYADDAAVIAAALSALGSVINKYRA